MMFEVAQSNCAGIFPTEHKMFCENLKEIQSLDKTLYELYTYLSSWIVKKWTRPGFESGTSRIRGENHTPRPQAKLK